MAIKLTDARPFLLGAAGAIVGAFLTPFIRHQFWDATWAAWAQALAGSGAIIAIAWQTGAPARLRQAEHRDVATFAVDAARASVAALEPFLSWAVGEGLYETRFGNFKQLYFGKHEDDTIVRLLALPLDRWPRLELYSEMRAYQHAVARLEVGSAPTIAPDGSMVAEGLKDSVKAVREAFRRVEAAAARV